jgi:hypothetical protein
MTEEKLQITYSCAFTLTTYEGTGHKDVCLEYTEHSTDHWHSDSETSIDLDADKAREIVAFLHKAFPEIAAQPSKPWVGLTDEEIKDVAASCMWWVREQDILDDAIELARAIEAKLKEKNA